MSFCFQRVLFFCQELMTIIDFGATDFWKFRFGCGPRTCCGPRTADCTETPGLTAGGADGTSRVGVVSGFVQHFFHMVKLSIERIKAIAIIAAGEENN